MQSADVYRQRMHEATGAIERRLAADPTVSLQIDRGADEWRIAIVPKSPAACAGEFLVRSGGSMDVLIGDVSAEALDLPDPNLLVAIIAAIGAGRVITRRWASTVSGRTIAQAAIVTLGEGRTWLAGAPPIAGVEAIVQSDRHFAPCGRGAVRTAASK